MTVTQFSVALGFSAEALLATRALLNEAVAANERGEKIDIEDVKVRIAELLKAGIELAPGAT